MFDFPIAVFDLRIAVGMMTVVPVSIVLEELMQVGCLGKLCFFWRLR